MKVILFFLWLTIAMFFQMSAIGQSKNFESTNGKLKAYYTRLAYDDHGFTGKFADVIVELKGRGSLVFSREYSYQPYWQPLQRELTLVSRLIDRVGDGPAQRPDKHNICSNAAIVHKTDTSVVVHWRYAPDLTKPSFTDFNAAYNQVNNPAEFYTEYADEYFTIYANGAVERIAKQGCKSLSDWNDPENQFTQKFNLTLAGIVQTSLQVPKLQRLLSAPVKGERVKTSPAIGALLNFKFDDALGRNTTQTIEQISKSKCAVSGSNAYWQKGVSGTCLSFDSYSNAVILPASKVPVVGAEFTVEAWVAPQEYPINTAAIVDHLNLNQGYFVGLNAMGEIEFKARVGSEIVTLTSSSLPLYQWAHVVATYHKTKGLRIYINGRLAVNKPVSGSFEDAINDDISIGMTRSFLQFPAGAERNATKLFNTHLVFSGLIDELKLFNRNLTDLEIEAQYLALKPSQSQPLKPWVLPDSPKNQYGFGAITTNLKFSPEWDGLWRVGNYSDIVVTFKDKPWRFVFWRGTRFLPSLVTDYGIKGVWSSDQGPEHYNGQCYEHMSDMLCRFSNVRVISSTPARSIVHWRNSSVSIGYQWPSTDENGWGIWTDEYWTIYPDGVAVRNQILHNGTGLKIIEMNQNEILHHPTQRTEDVLLDDAVYLSNPSGEVEKFTRSSRITDKKIKTDKNLQFINLKSDAKQFQIGEVGTKIEVDIFQDVWWKGWNHYPVQLIPSDGTVGFQFDRASSSCPATFREVRHQLNKNTFESMVLYGLTNLRPEQLTSLNRFWNFAPELNVIKGGTFLGYKKNEKAYSLSKTSDNIQLTINATKESPLLNPAFLIANWGNEPGKLQLKLDGKIMSEGEAYEKGIEINTDGSFSMVIWLKCHFEKQLKVEITSLKN